MSPHTSGLVAESETGIFRKLEDIYQGLNLPGGQEDTTGLLTNTKDTQRVNGLVDDLHEALMSYQVCMSNCLISAMSYICIRLHYKEISMMRVVGLL